MKNKKLKLMIFSIIELLFGLALYLLFNRDAFVSKSLLSIIPIPTVRCHDNALVYILRNFGADFLWSVSFTMAIQVIVWKEKKKTILLLFGSFLGIFYELMQWFGLTSGTADIIDAIVYILGSLFAIIIIQGGKFYEEK